MEFLKGWTQDTIWLEPHVDVQSLVLVLYD